MKKALEDHTAEIKAEAAERVQDSLVLCGKIAEDSAKQASPVITGRLKNSMTYVVGREGSGQRTYTYFKKTKKKVVEESVTETIKEGDAGVMVVGTNVKYAPYVEKRKHMVFDSVESHKDEYRGIIRRIMEGK